MPLDARFYHSVSLTTGGTVDTSDPVGTLQETGLQTAPAGDAVETITSDPVGGSAVNFYRKIHVYNHETSAIQDPSLFVTMQSTPGQLSFAREKSVGDTSVDNWTMPVGYDDVDFVSPASWEDAVPLSLDTSDLAASSSVGVWLRVRVPAGQTEQPANTARLCLSGIL